MKFSQPRPDKNLERSINLPLFMFKLNCETVKLFIFISLPLSGEW